MLISWCHLDGPSEASGLPEAHGPPKVHGPQCHCTSLSPLSVALLLCNAFIKTTNTGKRLFRKLTISIMLNTIITFS